MRDISDLQVVKLDGNAGGKRFDGIGVVNGGGATSVLLKDYPEPQRSQILDLVYKPKFGASVSALLVEIPGDGNATQGSMPSHMHTREDLNYYRGYTWWILQEAKKRNPKLSLDGTAWSAPGWIGNGPGEGGRVPGWSYGDAAFWSQDMADYYVKWLQGLREIHGLELDAIGCRNEKGYSIEFAKIFRQALNAGGFSNVKLHAFDAWPGDKFDFVQDMASDPSARAAIDIIGAHVMYAKPDAHASPEVQTLAAAMNKPIWNTEDHVYLRGFDVAISIVECFNDNYIHSGATKIVNWYDIAAVYPIEPFPEDPATIVAHWPWSGHYRVREALWGYAHYGQFSEIGWTYLHSGCKQLSGGGSVVTLKSPGDDFSIIIETKGARQPQQVHFQVGDGLSHESLCVWRSDVKDIFARKDDITPRDGEFTLVLEPDSIYSLSSTRGQQKGSFSHVPEPTAFPFPYYETFDHYAKPSEHGYLPRYLADIADVFELVDRPDGHGRCLRQVVPLPTLSWSPDWQPYTILGDDQWGDYEFSADVYLNSGDTAGIMGRVNDVGTGYGFAPKGYILDLRDDGLCRLIVARGKKNKAELIGDAEQQALIKAGNDHGEGGEKVLASTQLSGIRSGRWHKLQLHFEGSTINATVDGVRVMAVNDPLYTRGMAGLIAGQETTRVSTPYFNNLLVKAHGSPVPSPASSSVGQTPLYRIDQTL